MLLLFACNKVRFSQGVANMITYSTVKALYSDILYKSKILYINFICTNVPVKFEFEFVTTEIQVSINLFGDKQFHCKEG